MDDKPLTPANAFINNSKDIKKGHSMQKNTYDSQMNERHGLPMPLMALLQVMSVR